MTLQDVIENYQLDEYRAGINYTISRDTDSSDLFIEYLDRPAWFKKNFQPAFDLHREKTHGIITNANAA